MLKLSIPAVRRSSLLTIVLLLTFSAMFPPALASAVEMARDTVAFKTAQTIVFDLDCISSGRIVDLDGDGINELIFTTGEALGTVPGLVCRYGKDSSGTFQFSWLLNPGESIMLEVADIDKDGRKDIVTVGRGDSVRVFYQQPDHSFIRRDADTTKRNGSCVNVADMNCDGLPDIIVTHIFLPEFRIYYQSPNRTFDSCQVCPCTPVYQTDVPAEIADVDGDGYPDVVLGTLFPPAAIQVYRRNASGKYLLWKSVPVMEGVPDFVVGDFTGDGRVDLVAAMEGGAPQIMLFVQDAFGGFPEVPMFVPCAEFPRTMEKGDINGDGRDDVVIAHYAWGGGMSVSLQKESGGLANPFWFHLPSSNLLSPRSLAVGDVTGDGRQDVIALPPRGEIIIYESTTPQVTGVEEGEPSIPRRIVFHQNYPNPFNPETVISYELPSASEVNIRIYDVLGREVATLQSGVMEAGTHRLKWNAKGLPSGVYMSCLQVGQFTEVRKMIMTK